MYEFWTEKKIRKKKSENFSKKKFFFAFFWSKSRNGGEITNLCQKQNHEMEGITNFEITKCGDPLYLKASQACPISIQTNILCPELYFILLYEKCWNLQEEKGAFYESFSWTLGSVVVQYQQLWSFKLKSYEIRSRQFWLRFNWKLLWYYHFKTLILQGFFIWRAFFWS